MAKRMRHRRGFTLVELLVALMVSSIVLSAVGALAHAMSTAIEQTDSMGARQAELRYATMRLRELIRSSVRIWRIPHNIVLWSGDSNGDENINAFELTYVQTSSDASTLEIVTFGEQTTVVTAAGITNDSAKSSLTSDSSKYRTLSLFKQCSSVWFEVDDTSNSKFVEISFDITDNGITSSYQICATRMGSADNMFDSFGDLVAGDDD